MDSRKAREQSFHNKVFSDNSRWQQVSKFYAITQRSLKFYEAFLDAHAPGKRVLEYGCGPDGFALSLAEKAARVTGIDISDVAVQMSQDEAKARGLENLDFQQMDAEALTFEDGTFDLICGTGIIHHLELDRAYAELARTLRPDGYAIFREPLGHNFLINWYRNRTPHLRTEDEHPLLVKDLHLSSAYFDHVKYHYFHFASIAATPFRKLPGFGLLLGMLEKFDQLAFALLPPLRKQAWMVVIVLGGPRKG